METLYKTDNEVKEYLAHVPDENMVRIIRNSTGLELDREHPYSEMCRKYVWLDIIIKKLQDIMRSERRILPYLLSVECRNDNKDQWYNMDLKACLEEERIKSVTNALMPLYAMGALSQELLEVEKLQRLFDTAESFTLNFDCGDRSWKTIKLDPTQSYPVEFTFGPHNESLYMRVCPHCGAHIPSLLGIYEQRIISFIGSPASGKSTIINSVYSCLHLGERHPHVTASIYSYEPHYALYERAYKAMKYDHLAVLKTDIGTYPSLTLTVKSGGEEVLYTFVDVPGEHFIESKEDDQIKKQEQKTTTIELSRTAADMHHLAIMKHSKAVCVVIAAEQVLTIDQQQEGNDHAMATKDDTILDEFVERVQQFKTQVGTMPPVFFIVSKPDAFPHDKEGDFSPREEAGRGRTELWNWCDQNDEDLVTKENIEDLYTSLMQSGEVMRQSHPNGQDAGGWVADFSSLFHQQELAHKILFHMNGSTLLESLAVALTGSPEWGRIPLFMISPFGFYALNTPLQMSENEKCSAFRENEKTRTLSEEEMQILASAVKEQQLLELGKEKGSSESTEQTESSASTDQENDKQNEKINAVQRAHNLSKNDIVTILLNYYRRMHQNEKAYGAEQFLAWLMSFTGLYDFVCMTENLDHTEIIVKNRVRHEKLDLYDPSFRKSEEDYTAKYNRLVNRCKLLEQKMQQKQAELDTYRGLFHIGDRLRCEREIQDLDRELGAVRDELDTLRSQPLD